MHSRLKLGHSPNSITQGDDSMKRPHRSLFLALLAGAVALIVACGPATTPSPTATVAKPAASSPAASSPAPSPKPAVAPSPIAAASPVAVPTPTLNPLAKKGGTVTFAVSSDVTNPNPVINTQSVGQYIKESMYESLLAWDAGEGNLHPNLAESWTISSDVKQFTFRLRRGVKFHSGQEMKADDVLWSFNYVADPQNSATGQTRMALVATAEKVDDYAVRFTLKDPAVTFLSYLGDMRALPIMQANSLQRGQVDVGQKPPPGTGPFKFVEYQANTQVTVERFADYWDTAPYLDRVIFRVLPNETVRFNALRAGDVQITERVPIDSIRRVQSGEIPGLTMKNAPDSGLRRIALNMTSPFMKDILLRKAVQYSLNRDEMLEEIFQGLGTAANTKMPPASVWHSVAPPPPARDLAKARQLMQEAGYSGQEINLVGRRGHESFLESTQRMLSEAGFNVKTEVVESAVSDERKSRGQYDLSTQGGGLEFDPSISMKAFFICEQSDRRGDNDAGYCNPKMDELFNALDREPDQNKRLELFRQITQVLADEVPWIYIGTEPRYFAFGANVRDFTPTSGGSYLHRFGGLKRTWLAS